MFANSGEYSSLRRADRRGLEDSVFHHARSKKSFDQIEDVPVGHLRPHGCHNHAMRKIVEEPLNVRVEHYTVPHDSA